MSHPPPPPLNLGQNGVLRSDASADAADHAMSIQGVGSSSNSAGGLYPQGGASYSPSSGGFSTVKLSKIIACEIKVPVLCFAYPCCTVPRRGWLHASLPCSFAMHALDCNYTDARRRLAALCVPSRAEDGCMQACPVLSQCTHCSTLIGTTR